MSFCHVTVILHDAEDIVHADELTVYDTLIERFDLVQLPVEPVVVRGAGRHAALVSGHYCGEFAEAHGKQVVVREAVGAAVPSAGVGCAIARGALGRIAAAAGGAPFDPHSLTEDYELYGVQDNMYYADERVIWGRLPEARLPGMHSTKASPYNFLAVAI